MGEGGDIFQLYLPTLRAIVKEALSVCLPLFLRPSPPGSFSEILCCKDHETWDSNKILYGFFFINRITGQKFWRREEDRSSLKGLGHQMNTGIFLKAYKIKGTVFRDFRLLVFFMNQFPPTTYYGHFKFFRKLAEIFAAQGAQPVSTPPVANGKIFKQKNLIILFGHLWVVE